MTEADLAANRVILDWISLVHPDDHVLSEEAVIPNYQERRDWKRVWIVDPLDGTSEFVAGNLEYGVSIGVCQNGVIEEGVIIAPALGLIAWGGLGQGAWRADVTREDLLECDGGIPDSLWNKLNYQKVALKISGRYPQYSPDISILCSRSHNDPDTLKAIGSFPGAERITVGACIKFIRLAQGVADYYPRLKSLHEWDIAGGHAIVKAAGGNMYEYGTRREVTYNSPTLGSPPFEAY